MSWLFQSDIDKVMHMYSQGRIGQSCSIKVALNSVFGGQVCSGFTQCGQRVHLLTDLCSVHDVLFAMPHVHV